MASQYPFGDLVTGDNFKALRSLAKKLTYREFSESTGFARGIHNRLRRFSNYKEYQNYSKENYRKYYPRRKKKTINIKDVYNKLLKIEKMLKDQQS